jgi:hypothetical protein
LLHIALKIDPELCNTASQPSINGIVKRPQPLKQLLVADEIG